MWGYTAVDSEDAQFIIKLYSINIFIILYLRYFFAPVHSDIPSNVHLLVRSFIHSFVLCNQLATISGETILVEN